MKDNKGLIYSLTILAVIGIGIYLLFPGSKDFEMNKYSAKRESNTRKTSSLLKPDEKLRRQGQEKPHTISKPKSNKGRKIAGTQIGPQIKQATRESFKMSYRAPSNTKLAPEFSDFTFREVNYSLVKNYIAVPADESIPYDKRVKEFNNTYIIKFDGDNPPPEAKAVVLNKGTGNFAIFTGVLRVKLSEYSMKEEIIDRLNKGVSDSAQVVSPKITDEHENIQVATYQFDNYEQTMFVYKTLQTEPFQDDVKRVNIDLIEWSRKEN